ncbi:hypothetical protein LTR49_018008 [Elasticomyces elasticus]|nr:hypothetical protein LTR49_018008 [Elasticomyces elasticus]
MVYQSAAIQMWVEESIASTQTFKASHRLPKRKRAAATHVRARKRPALRGMSGNAMPGRAVVTPKRRLQGPVEQEQGDAWQDDPQAEWEDTPRPIRAAGHSSSSATRSSATSSKRSRTSSPTKASMLLSLQNPVETARLDERGISALPQDIQELLRGVLDYAEGYGTVPEHFKPSPNRRTIRRSDIFFASSSARDKLGGAPTLAEVDRITSRASQCREYKEHEAAWNTFVHGPLLDLAQYTSVYRQRIDVANITTAPLSTRFKPRFATSAQPMLGKLVDFAILLNRSTPLDQAFRAMPLHESEDAKSFNQTLHMPVMRRPIAISIETKREGEGALEGLTQLSVWTSAHFLRLEELVQWRNDEDRGLVEQPERSTVMPPLPLILVQGPQWSLLIATKSPNGTTTVHEKIDFGDATARLGVFKIVSVLHLLCRWAEEVYRPWFEEHCLG